MSALSDAEEALKTIACNLIHAFGGEQQMPVFERQIYNTARFSLDRIEKYREDYHLLDRACFERGCMNAQYPAPKDAVKCMIEEISKPSGPSPEEGGPTK